LMRSTVALMRSSSDSNGSNGSSTITKNASSDLKSERHRYAEDRLFTNTKRVRLTVGDWSPRAKLAILTPKPTSCPLCAASDVVTQTDHHTKVTTFTCRLLAEIRRAEFVVADFTGHKKGVYYEAGFARALGREVIMMCRDSDFGGLHFDTSHMNHIKWSETIDLRQRLADRIRATILPKA